MQHILSLALVVIGMFVLQYEARPNADGTYMYSDKMRGTKSFLLTRRLHNERYVQDKKLQSRSDENRTKKITYTKEEIDSKKVNVNSDLEVLFESMSDNGHKAVGIHPEQKGIIKAMKLEEKHGSRKNHRKKHARRTTLKTKRNFVPQIETIEFDRYWPNATIPYYINLDLFENKEKVNTTIREAKEDFEAKTCVELISKSAKEIETEELEFYVNITNKPDGCYSEVGILEEAMNKGQILNLMESGCIYKSTVLHEFCHALGMQHEQSRQDRDKHVTVNFNNIIEDEKFNLEKEETLDRNPYDYFSVMQYELKAFSNKNWENIMNFRDPELEFLAGLSTELSFYDVLDITKAYGCSDDCQSDKVCKNTGFIDHQCKCYCPEGLKGDDCDTIESDDCGGIIDLVPGQEVEITSPNYPNNYDVGQKCYWLLRAQNKEQRVMIKFLDFDLPSNEELFRCYHWLEVRYNLIGQPGKKFCDDRLSRNKISSTEFGNPELMMLIFDTATVTGVQATKGFRIIAEAFEVKPNDPIFQCDFEDGQCGVTLSSDDDTYKWYVDTETEPNEDGVVTAHDNSYFKIDPLETDKMTFVRFGVPKFLNVDKTYCLSFYFRRSSVNEKCAALYVGDRYYYRWTGPWNDISVSRTKIYFTAEIEKEDGGEFNFDIDDIIISEGHC